jgi:hypothetical protein
VLNLKDRSFADLLLGLIFNSSFPAMTGFRDKALPMAWFFPQVQRIACGSQIQAELHFLKRFFTNLSSKE